MDPVALPFRVRYSCRVPTYPDLAHKVVLVTGGANGIGAATVRAFHEQKTVVHFCDIDRAAGGELAAEMPNSSFAKVDLTSEKETIRWIGAIRKRGPIDVLVNNAAIDPRIPLHELTSKSLDSLFALNLRSFFITARETAPAMSRGGSMVNLASITFHTAPSQMSAYVAMKAGIIGFTRSLARELGPRGIRVNTVSPGWTMTERQLRDYVNANTKKLIKKSQCIPELLQPAEIADIILFLASGASRALTGQELLADRGWAHS
jgi:NAD(P)-dependent dehydrogenase (short-subunit alcohol dehydrogenase family)